MTYAIDLHTSRAGQPGLFARLRRSLADHRAYRAACKELSALSDRQLADIGVSRRILREAARAAFLAA